MGNALGNKAINEEVAGKLWCHAAIMSPRAWTWPPITPSPSMDGFG